MNIIDRHQCDYDLTPQNLKRASIFGALSDEGIEFLISKGCLEEYQANEVVFSEGSVANCFYIILHGEIGLFKTARDPSKGTTHINFGEGVIRFGEELGYVTMIALNPRACDSQALERTLVLKVDSFVFNDFHDAYSFDFGIMILNLSRDIARKIRKLSDALAEHGLSLVPVKSHS